MASAGYPVYTASKAATHGLTRGLARDLGAYSIRVNTLVPGWVMTEKQLKLFEHWARGIAESNGSCVECNRGFEKGDIIQKEFTLSLIV